MSGSKFQTFPGQALDELGHLLCVPKDVRSGPPCSGTTTRLLSWGVPGQHLRIAKKMRSSGIHLEARPFVEL